MSRPDDNPHDPDATIADASGGAAAPHDPDATIPGEGSPIPLSAPSGSLRPQTFADMPAPGSFRGNVDVSNTAPSADDDATILESPTHTGTGTFGTSPGTTSVSDVTMLEDAPSQASVPDADMTMLPADEQPTHAGSLGGGSKGPVTGASGLSHSVSNLGNTQLPSSCANLRLQAGSPETELYAGRYEIERELARGGMGVVYKARHVDLNQTVALKVMLSGIGASPTARRRFLFEAEASAKLKHPNIVPVFDIGEHGENLYFTMQFVEGQDLKARQKELTRAQYLDVMIKVAKGVGFAHQRGIIHRDLKPANVMMDKDDQPLIMDFGLAKQLEDEESGAISQSQTMEGTVFGTPHYMPPEQASGEISEVDVRSDVYALGVMLYGFYTGELPYQGNSTAELLNKILNREAISPRQVDASIDRDLEAIVLKSMEKEKERRYASAVQLGEDLQRYKDGLPVVARRATLGYRFTKWARRHRGQLVAAAVLFAAAAAAAGVGIQQHLAGITSGLETAAEERRTYEGEAKTLADRLSALQVAGLEPDARAAEVVSIQDAGGALDGRLDTLLVSLESLMRAPLQSQRLRANELLKGARKVSLAVDASLERTSGLRRAQNELASASSLLEGSVPELEAAAVAALGSSVQLEPAESVPGVEGDDPGAILDAHTQHYASKLRAIRELGLQAVAAGEAGAAQRSLDEGLTGLTRSAFTAHNLAGSGTPEASEAERLIAAAQAVRARVEAARDHAARQAQAAQLAAFAQALLVPFEATPFNKATRIPRLRAAGMAQALVQQGLEADPSGTEALAAARLAADVAYAIALLDTKSFSAFDEFVDREGSFSTAQRDRLEQAKATRLETLHKLRRRLRGGSAKIEIQGGSGVELGGNSRPELQVIANTAKLRQLAKLAEHPLMDDELELLRVEAVEKAERALALAKRKTAEKQIDGAIAAVREQTQALSVAERAEQVAVLAKAWEKARKKLDRKASDLDPASAAAKRKAITTGLAALYRGAALTLADSAPVRARTLARQAMSAIQGLYDAGDAPVELLESYRERLSGLLGS